MTDTPPNRPENDSRVDVNDDDSDEVGPAEDSLDLFRDPDDYYPPTPPPTTQTHRTLSGDEIRLHLVGHSSLEAHHLWNGARVVSDHFESEPATTVRGRTVLELGAGAGLPSLVAASPSLGGARRVLVTDYPDPDLVENLWKNIRACHLLDHDEGRLNIAADGFVWGADPSRLLAFLEKEEGKTEEEKAQEEKKKKTEEKDGDGDGNQTTENFQNGNPAAAHQDQDKDKPQTNKTPRKLGGFDVLILADLLFRHSEHGNMLKTVRETLKKSKDARAYVVFCSYRPWLRQKDLAFFDLAREQGFLVEQILERKMERPLFEDDPGDVDVLKTVTGWTLRWPDEVCEY